MKNGMHNKGETLRRVSLWNRIAILSVAVALALAAAANADFLTVFPTDDNHVVSFASGLTPGNNDDMRLLNTGNAEWIFMKYTLPTGWLGGSASGAILEIVKAGEGSGTNNPSIRLWKAGNFLTSDGGTTDTATLWTENNITWDTMPRIIPVEELDTNVNPGELVSPTLRSIGTGHQFSSVAMDAYINSVGPGGVISFAVIFGNVDGTAEEAYYEKDYADPNFWPSLNFNAVPEPSTISLLGFGAWLWFHRRGRSRA